MIFYSYFLAKACCNPKEPTTSLRVEFVIRNICQPGLMTKHILLYSIKTSQLPGRVAQSVGHLTRKSGVLGSIPGLATYFRFFFRFFKKGSCQLLAKVCARSTG